MYVAASWGDRFALLLELFSELKDHFLNLRGGSFLTYQEMAFVRVTGTYFVLFMCSHVC